MFGNAVVMGLSPADVKAMSLAEWLAVCDGWQHAHGGGDDKVEPPSAEEYYRLISQRK